MAHKRHTLGERLKSLRLDRGLSTYALEARTVQLGQRISANHISKLERGERRNPGYRTVKVLAAALEVEPDILFGSDKAA